MKFDVLATCIIVDAIVIKYTANKHTDTLHKLL